MKFCKLASVATALVLSTSVNAALIGVHFEGVIYQADNMTSDAYNNPAEAWIVELESLFNVGDSVSGNYFYDSVALPFLSNTNGVDTENVYPIVGFEIFINGFSGQANGGGLSIIDGYYGGSDQYAVWTDIDNDISSSGTLASLFAAGLGVYDRTQSLFSGAELPMLPPDLSLYSDRQVTLMFTEDISKPNQGSFVINASLDTLEAISPVPIPAAVWLFGSGLIGLAGIARRKKA